MTVFEGLMGQSIKTTPRGMRHLPDQGMTVAEMISSGAYRVVVAMERMLRPR